MDINWILLSLFPVYFFLFFINSFISNLLAVLIIFFIPGFIISKNFHWLERIVLSPIISVSLAILTAFLLNSFLKIPINNFFLFQIFVLEFSIVLLSLKFLKIKDRFELNFTKKELYIFILLILFVIVTRVLIISRIDTLIGTDISRYAIVSHTMLLKQQITTDLRPYDLAENFFYFPVSFILPLLIELIGVDALHSITYYSFFFNILSVISFFLFTSKLLDKKRAFYATFFFAFFYDVGFEYLISRGVFSFAISFYPLLLSLFYILRIYDENRGKFGLLLSLTFLFLTHWYHLFVITAFYFSILLNEFAFEKTIKKSVKLGFKIFKIVPLLLLFLSPYLIFFGPKYFETQKDWKFADWKMYEISLERQDPVSKVLSMIYVSFATPTRAIIYSLGFLVSIFVSNILIKEKKATLVFLFILLFVSSFFYIPSITWKRLVDNVRLTYPIFFSFVFDNPVFVGISILSLPFAENSPIWYYYKIPSSDLRYSQFFDVVSKEELKAFNFIKTNISENSVFMLDGGGAGCVGGQAGSHGDRIFPLTSRKVFYYTNFCPGLFDLEEYQKKTDLYRKLSINPDDEETINQINNYNVTHIYIGPQYVGLDPSLLLKSKNYRLIFNENRVYIFQIL